MVFSEKINHIHNISDFRQQINENNYETPYREVITSSFSSTKLSEKPVYQSNFANLGRNILINQEQLQQSNAIKNTTGQLDFNINEYIKKRPEGLENTKSLLNNFEKIAKGEQPKLIPLQSFTSSHLQDLMAPVVKAVQSNIKQMKKLDEKIEKQEKEKENMIEKILEKQNEIINFMMHKNEDKKNRKIKLKYQELQQELDRIELGLSPDYSKFNFLHEELNYMLNKEAEEQSTFFCELNFVIIFSNKEL